MKLASAPPTMVTFDSATALFGLKPASSSYAHDLDVRKAILLWPFLLDFECGGGRCERFASVVPAWQCKRVAYHMHAPAA